MKLYIVFEDSYPFEHSDIIGFYETDAEALKVTNEGHNRSYADFDIDWIQKKEEAKTHKFADWTGGREEKVTWRIPHPGTLEHTIIPSFEEAMEKWFEGFNIPVKLTNGVAEDFKVSCQRVHDYFKR